ncbi:MAG: pantoate kinase [Promethearchaeota archaeon]
MSERVNKVIVNIPHRISGFFEIVDEINGIKIEDPERIGSRGAGFCVDAVGKTEVIIQNINARDEFELKIYINGKKLNQKAETTHYIINYIKNYIKKSFKVRINHNFDLPVGCGYGASGSGALGTIFGLDYLLNLKLSLQEKGKIAHIAEVVNKTGLGTVCGQLNGGMGIIREPGFPCVYERIKVPHNLIIICGSFGIIHTKSILNDPVLSLKIKDAGKRALTKLIKEPNIKTFIKASLEFVKSTEILEILQLSKINDLIKNLNKLDIIGASMNQLGRSVYAICRKDNEKEVLNVFESYKPEITVYSTSIHKSKSIF